MKGESIGQGDWDYTGFAFASGGKYYYIMSTTITYYFYCKILSLYSVTIIHVHPHQC